MIEKSANILQHFIDDPILKIASEKYPFKNFDFLGEVIDKNEFALPKHLVLGMQAEASFEAYLKQSKHYGLLTANLQINADKQTLGELDYIVRNLTTNRVIHVELACKFYLYDHHAGTSEEEKWIGPNRKDSLFDKLEKMKLKQFPLLYKNETIEKLKALQIEIPDEQQLCLKAFLFIPKKSHSKNFRCNYSDCLVGTWIKHIDFSEEDKTAIYAIPDKKQWLLPMEEIENWFTFPEMEKLVEIHIQNKKSPLLYKKTRTKMERLFVVWWY